VPKGIAFGQELTGLRRSCGDSVEKRGASARRYDTEEDRGYDGMRFQRRDESTEGWLLLRPTVAFDTITDYEYIFEPI